MLAVNTGAADSSPIDLRVDLSHLYSDDNQTSRHLSFTQLRSTFDSGFSDFEFHLDGRGRFSWNDQRDSEEEITWLYFQYGHDNNNFKYGRDDDFWIALGRQTILSVDNTRVDGIRAGCRFSDLISADVFGGLMPHPLNGNFNADFATAGAGLRAENKDIQNLGGFAVQTYSWEMDRLFFTDRILWQIGSEWSWFGYAVVDPSAPRGLWADLTEKPSQRKSGGKGPDLTSGQLMLRFHPAGVGDFTLRVSHYHTILPGAWWRDWIERERARLGFIVEEDPIGTRESSADLGSNVHISRLLTPHAALKYEYRHSDRRYGYSARGGLKFLFGDVSYADISYSYARHFIVQNHVVELLFGLDPLPAVTLEMNAAGTRSRPLALSDAWLLLDSGAALWVDLGQITRTLDNLRIVLQYQFFFEEPDLIYHVGDFRIVYRFTY